MKTKQISQASIEYGNPAEIEKVGLICLAVKNGGKTLKKLQKMIYFTQYTGHEISDYMSGYNGPASNWTANLVNVAVDIGAIDRTEEFKIWHYSITEKGTKFLKRLSKNHDDKTKLLFEYLGNMDHTIEMLAASIDYIQKNDKGIKKAEIKKKMSYITRLTGGFDEALVKLENIRSIIKTGELLPHEWKYHAGDNKFALCKACRMIKHELKTETCYFHPDGSEITIKKGNETSLPKCEQVKSKQL